MSRLTAVCACFISLVEQGPYIQLFMFPNRVSDFPENFFSPDFCKVSIFNCRVKGCNLLTWKPSRRPILNPFPGFRHDKMADGSFLAGWEGEFTHDFELVTGSASAGGVEVVSAAQHRGGIGQGLWPGNLFLSWSPSLLSDLAAPPLCATRTAQHICCRPCRALNNSRTLKGLTRKVIRLPHQSRHPPYREGVIPATSPQSVIIVIIFFSSKFGKKLR